MSAAEMMLERMRRTSSGYHPKDFETLYLGFGFLSKEGKKHTTYYHPKYPTLRDQVARHKFLADYFAENAVALIDELLELENNDDEGDGDDTGE
jgi:hypothetical protein